ncbi:hypothetical protein F5Y19DRAFT_461732 [Xylariaceae sp. FL1651]|nr:hypothetical protein F5Y19DRAFT_461732 [Xylariaceae sp. FL1651]
MESASPTASASTNRGGRPKDWTEPRTRRLIRLYLFTTLPFPKILDLLEEDEFKPGKDAANKVKNSVLGNDPRWIRPKDDDEERTRIRGLRNSLRGRRRSKDTAPQKLTPAAADHNASPAYVQEDGSLGGTTVAHSYRSSTEELNHADAVPIANPSTCADTFTSSYDETGTTHFAPSFISRRNTSRQDTGLTTSTDITISSVIMQKLSDFSITKVKRACKVLKRYTFPANAECPRSSTVSPGLFQGPNFRSHPNEVDDSLSAKYAVPGDFLNAELLACRQQCATSTGCTSHAAETCWCKVADQVSAALRVWTPFREPYRTPNPNLNVKDMFGNTAFHCLAATEGIQDLFLHLVCQALREPRLPIHDTNTAGQTFLHVLHRSWFQEGSRLGELIDTLRNENFDVLATDVYGRNFYHLLRLNMKGSARFPNQAFDIHRMNRRDAFGMKPMDSRPLKNSDYPIAHMQTTQRNGTTATTTSLRAAANIIPRINMESETADVKELTTHADLLRVVTSAVGVDDLVFPNPGREDFHGRNGFHCLAEVNMGLSPDTPSSSIRHGKRKHGEDEGVETPKTSRESQRLNYIQGLIHNKVDVNQYDKQGSTPLMSFVVNSSDATRMEKEESENIIKALIKDAGANMESRNRQGETALHLAARYGKTVALRVLLELGANPHTRNAQGLGVLEVLDGLYLTTERDDKNNARFEACRAILTRTTKYAIQNPTILHEWAIR